MQIFGGRLKPSATVQTTHPIQSAYLNHDLIRANKDMLCFSKLSACAGTGSVLRMTFIPANVWATGMISMELTFMCAGR